jgi:hypothetical protein
VQPWGLEPPKSHRAMLACGRCRLQTLKVGTLRLQLHDEPMAWYSNGN